ANATDLSLGNGPTALNDFYGILDEVRIWNTTRTAAEIADNKKVALRGDEMGLVGQWKFDGNLYDGTSGGDTAATYSNALNGTYQRYADGWSTVGATYGASVVGEGDPIVLDLDGDGVSLVGRDAGVRFDIDQAEGAEATGWMGPGEGLLAMDLDGDGVISSMGEVFSNRFAGGNHTTSLDALATLDSNSDGMINALDDRFADILVWQDGNQDGSSSTAELQGLDGHNVTAIDLGADKVYETGPDGSYVDARGEFTFGDGSTGEYVEATFGFTDSNIAEAVAAAAFVVDAGSAPLDTDTGTVVADAADAAGAEDAAPVADTVLVAEADTADADTADTADTDEAAAFVVDAGSAPLDTDTSTVVADAADAAGAEDAAPAADTVLVAEVDQADTDPEPEIEVDGYTTSTPSPLLVTTSSAEPTAIAA
ncbi:MAG: hypothetical protein QF485_09275, partial [Arenicellales bacterium]|nr:hypothetical protein [Arenicellales bacterium]